MFFNTANVDAKILSVIQMGWQRVNARAGYRPFHTLSYRLAGSANFFFDEQAPMRVEEGEIVFIPAGMDFEKHANEGHIIAIHFVSDSDLPKETLRFSPKNSSFFRTEFQQLHTVWSKRNPGYEYESKILLYRILLKMEQEWASGKNAASSHTLNTALTYIHDHFADASLSVESLASMCGMSDTYFRKLFVAEHGITPQRYIIGLRLTTATELLQSGYYTVDEIASRCGFNNINYFSTFIKKETGLSPLNYRKKLLEKAPHPF